jgi:thymidylate kinase
VDVVSITDATVTSRVLIVGSLPPEGRDYDLLVREADLGPMEAALRAHGFESIAQRWIRLGRVAAEAVELLTAADWRLPDREVEELFSQALPLEGRAHLCVPSPAHELLILARKLPRTPCLLEPKHRRRAAHALARAPDAFEQARERASDWHLQKRLRRLRRRYARPRAGSVARYLRRPRRGAVVALSGLDGAGKSTQAEALRASLVKLGFDVVVVWAPIGSNKSLRRLARAVKQLLARLPLGPLAKADRARVERRLLSQDHGGTSGGHWRVVAVPVWSTVTTLANAVSYRRAARGMRMRGRIVIYDRYVLDTLVELRFAYAPEGHMPRQEALIRFLAPRPRCAFLLDVEPEIAHERKSDWSLAETRLRGELYRHLYPRLGVRRLDATLPAEDLATQILREVLPAMAFS